MGIDRNKHTGVTTGIGAEVFSAIIGANQKDVYDFIILLHGNSSLSYLYFGQSFVVQRTLDLVDIVLRVVVKLYFILDA